MECAGVTDYRLDRVVVLGYFGPARIPSIPQSGNLIHVLLVIILILIILRLVR